MNGQKRLLWVCIECSAPSLSPIAHVLSLVFKNNRQVADWANVIYEYARQNGKFGNMELVEDLCRGEDVQAAAPGA